MANAMPMIMAIKGSPPQVEAATREVTGPIGTAGSSKTGAISTLMASETQTETISAVVPASATYPFPHTTYRVFVNNYTTYPYRTVGKVFFTKATGGNFVCSGSSIGGRVVLTAGHCVSDGQGKFHKNWVFVPAYRGWLANTGTQQRPYGTWPAMNLFTWSSWHNNARWCRDVGAATTLNQGGKKLSQRVGYLGRSWNYNRSKQHWDMFGYPSASPWDGRYMVQTGAEWARSYNTGNCTPNPMGIGTRQRPGSSGGPWIRTFYPNQSGANNYAGSVTSHYFTAQPNGMYGPYFDKTINDWLFDKISK